MTATAAQSPSPNRRRRARIGSDDARKWARKLDLGNPYAKSILVAVANYMNEDGSAFPGIETIADDTDIAQDTVISRLRWCETIGAIAIFKCWADENGMRNYDGRGRVTSSEIRFLMDADPVEIAAAAVVNSKPKALRGAALASHQARAVSPRPDGELSDSNDPEISTRPCRGLTDDGSSLAPEQPPTPADRREEGKNKKDSPPTPQAGGDGSPIDQGIEGSEAKTWSGADTWPGFEAAWSEPILRQSIARQVYSALTDDERTRASKAARGYVAWRRSQKKPPNVINAHTFLRERDAWAAYEKLAPAEPKPAPAPKPETFIKTGSDEFEVMCLMNAIVCKPMPSPGTNGGVIYIGTPPAGALALAMLVRRNSETGEVDKTGWWIAEKDSPKYVAWCERAAEWLGWWPEEKNYWLDRDNNVVATAKEAEFGDTHWSVSGKLPKCKKGLLVPFTENGFPPAKGEQSKEPDNTS